LLQRYIAISATSVIWIARGHAVAEAINAQDMTGGPDDRLVIVDGGDRADDICAPANEQWFVDRARELPVLWRGSSDLAQDLFRVCRR